MKLKPGSSRSVTACSKHLTRLYRFDYWYILLPYLRTLRRYTNPIVFIIIII